MSNYTKSTNFATKDNLTPGDPLKVVRGTEIDTEYNNIATAVATKTDNASAAITGGSIVNITDLAVADGGTGASTAATGLNNLLPSQTSNANKYLQTDGTNATWDAVTLSTADITGTLPVANGGTGVTSSTGTGNVVLSNSPTLVTPALGTPSSAVLINATGLPISAGVSGLGTGVAAFLGTPSSANLISAVTDETGTGSLVFATSPTLVTPALGTPSALVGTNITGTASGLTAGNVTTNANLTGAVTSVGNATSLGSFTSAQLLGALTDETGTGAAVFGTNPTLTGATLAGTVAGDGNQINNVVIGASTPLAGSFTTLSASTLVTASTSTNVLFNGFNVVNSSTGAAAQTAYKLTNSSAALSVLSLQSTGFTAFGTLTAGSLALYHDAAAGITIASANASGSVSLAVGATPTAIATVSSTGLAVTGAFSSTSDATINSLTVGRGAGAVATNTAVGGIALAANSSGIQNAAFGYLAATTNTTGGANTALGVVALTTNSTGSNNSAIGAFALYNNTTASNNTAVGYQAGYSNTTGTGITAVGYQAGSAITTGSKNTIIGGYNGNQGGLDIRTLSNYLVLSDGDGNPLISTNSTRSVALNGAVPQTGTGITFPATQNASADVNTLDDYEEGTWTPVVTSTGGTYANQVGRYTKIGQVVTCDFFLQNGSAFTYASAIAAWTITGLPFAPSSWSYTGPTGTMWSQAFNFNNTESATVAFVTPTATSSSTIIFKTSGSGVSSGSVKNDNNASFIVTGQVVYTV